MWFEEVTKFSRMANEAQNKLNPEKWPLLPVKPVALAEPAKEFIIQMIDDEMDELVEAKDLVEQADALLDIIYYVLDTGAKHGMELRFDTSRCQTHPPLTDLYDVPMSFKKDIAHCLNNLVKSDDVIDHALALIEVCEVCISTADNMGVDLNPIFDIVQGANMAKFVDGVVVLDTDVTSKRYGKVQKPIGWTAPDSKIKEEISRQGITIDYGNQDPDEWIKEQRRLAEEKRNTDNGL